MSFSGLISRLLLLAVFTLTVHGLFAAEVIPKAPTQHFNDYANVISSDISTRLDAQLVAFERETSNQIVVAIFPKMESASSIEDFAIRTYQAWGIGTKAKNNGALLLIFIQNRTMYLQTGYGLEGAIPDVTAKRIIEDEIKPFFRNGDYNSGVNAGVQAILQAAKGEYQGSGRTVHQNKGSAADWIPLLFMAIFVFAFIQKFRAGTLLTGSGRSWSSGGGWHGGGGGSWGGGGGGGFSGGGGSSGGGGAGGSW